MTVFSDMVTKMETVLSTTIGLKLEDLSAIDQNNWTANPLCQLVYDGYTPEDNFGERPKPKDANFTIQLRWRVKTQAEARDEINYWEDQIYSNMTVANINDTAKSVRFINHLGATSDLQNKLVFLDYPITVRYRDT